MNPFSVFIPDVLNFIELNFVLVVIMCLLNKYIEHHFSWGDNRLHRRDLLLQTIAFSVSITYRAVMNILKLVYSTRVNLADQNDPNPIEDLET
jgi:hypothetical protein